MIYKKTTLILLFLLILPQTIKPNPPSFRGIIAAIRDLPPIEFGLAGAAITAIIYIGALAAIRIHRHLQKPYFKIYKNDDIYQIQLIWSGDLVYSFTSNNQFQNNYLNGKKFDFRPPSLLYVDDQLVCDLDALSEFPAKIELP